MPSQHSLACLFLSAIVYGCENTFSLKTINYVIHSFIKNKKSSKLRGGLINLQYTEIYISIEILLPPAAFSKRFIMAAPTPSAEVVVAKIIVALVLSHALRASYKFAPISS